MMKEWCSAAQTLRQEGSQRCSQVEKIIWSPTSVNNNSVHVITEPRFEPEVRSRLDPSQDLLQFEIFLLRV